MTATANSASGSMADNGREPYVPVLGWFGVTRVVTSAGVFLVLTALAAFGGSPYDLHVAQGICLLEVALTGLVYRPWYRRRVALPVLAHVQLGMDLVLICIGVSTIGGIHSQFLPVYNILILSAGLLSLSYTILYTLLCSAVLVGLTLGAMLSPADAPIIEGFPATAHLVIHLSMYLLTAVLVSYYRRNIERQKESLREAQGTLLNAFQALEVYREQLEHSNRDLKQAARVKSEFLALVSHELRTPLNSVIGFADLLLDPPAAISDDEKRVFLAAVRDNGRDLLGVIDQILELSRLDTGSVSAGFEDVDLGLMIEDTLPWLQRQGAARGLHVACEVAPDLPRVRAEPRRLKRVLEILLENALEFSRRGGQIGLSARPDCVGKVLVCVSDEGEGIEAEHLPHIFEPFYQVEQVRTRRHGGTGLGLTIARTLVDIHQGEIWAESRPKEGSSFFVRLPATALPPGPAAAPA